MDEFINYFQNLHAHSWKDHLGLWSSIILPFFNIPLMIRLYQRKSSQDLSMTWVLGVFFCLAGMLPDGLESHDFTYKIFAVFNLAFFAGVTFLVLYYRIRKS